MAAESLASCIAMQIELILIKYKTTLLPNSIRRVASKDPISVPII